jgi:hypothetical protein
MIAIVRLLTDILMDWIELRVITDVLVTKNINAEEGSILPPFLVIVCIAYNVRTL